VKPQQQFEAMLAFFGRHSVTHVNLSALVPKPSGDTSMMHNDMPRTLEEAVKALPWARSENAARHDIYIRPARYIDGEPASWPMVFLDDVPPQMAKAISDKYASCVIETSPGRCHVWIATQQTLDEQQRAAVQTNLVARLRALSISYADPASTSGEHFGRPPGFKNWKRGGCWSNLKTISVSPLLDATTHLQSKDILAGKDKPQSAASASFSPPQGGRGVLNASGGGSPSESEFGWAIGYLRWWTRSGQSASAVEDHIVQTIADRALDRGKRATHHAAMEYAQRTFEAAVSALR
jgi:hypothetical protein